MPKLKLVRLIQLQIAYFTLSMLYNAISAFLLSINEPALSASPPLGGAITMLVYAGFLLSARLNSIVPYCFLMSRRHHCQCVWIVSEPGRCGRFFQKKPSGQCCAQHYRPFKSLFPSSSAVSASSFVTHLR